MVAVSLCVLTESGRGWTWDDDSCTYMERSEDATDCVHSFVPRVTVTGLFRETNRGGWSHNAIHLTLLKPGRSCRPRIKTPQSLVSTPGLWSGVLISYVRTLGLDSELGNL